MALAAQRCAESASAELAQARTRQAAAEQQAAELEQLLADEITVREDTERCATRKHSCKAGLRSIVRWALLFGQRICTWKCTAALSAACL